MVNAHGIVLAYDTRPELKELTQHRTVSSVPFGGKYRLVDFALSSLANAGVTDVGVVVRDNYRSLLDHLGSGRDWDMNRKTGGLMLLPPFCYGQSMQGSTFRGRLDALVGISYYLRAIRQKYVIVMDGDMVANVDLNKVLEEHQASKADITVVCTPSPMGSGQRAVYIKADETGRVRNVKVGGEPENCLQSMRIFVLETELLCKLVQSAEEQGQYDWVRDVLQRQVDVFHIRAYRHEGYCARINNVSDYYRRSMELLTREVRQSLFLPERPILTKVRDETSTYYGPDSQIGHSIVADGCYIEGRVENCILFRGVRIDKDAVVRDSVLMQGVHVQAGGNLRYTVADKNVIISKNQEMVGHSAYPFTISKGSKV